MEIDHPVLLPGTQWLDRLPCFIPPYLALRPRDSLDPARLIQVAPTDLCLDGNLKPLAFVEASPEEIEAEARRLIRLFGKRGRFILSSGCEIPPEARPENIEALGRAARLTPCERLSGIWPA